MKHRKLIIFAAVLLVAMIAVVVSRTDSDHEHDESDGHLQANAQDPHAGESEDHQVIELTAEQIDNIGIKLANAGGGDIDVFVSLPGEITFNQNKLAHIVPSVPGVVRRVVKNVGDSVAAGEVIAWLESTELGGAKVQFLARQSEVSCCSIELTRAQEVHDNTLKLLETLKTSPSLENLQKMDSGDMGMNRATLVSMYAELRFAEQAYTREKDLYEKKISSEQDFLKAQSALNKAHAQYAATRDSINFEVRRDLLEAMRAQQTREIELTAAERLLYVLGLSVQDVNDLTAMATNKNSQPQEEECNDPNCTECAAAQEQTPGIIDIGAANEKLAWYPIRTAFDGTIVNKHITLGEVVSNTAEIFVVADLSSVWVDLHVYPKDLTTIRKGQKAIISAGQTVPDVESTISYVGPVVGTGSRTALARVVLPNESGIFRPGLFVTAKIAVDQIKADVLVPKRAVQTLEGKKCVFTKDEHGFEPAFVNLGESNEEYIQITAGLEPDQSYVTDGAFELKAKMITSTLDSHAGHGH